METEKITINLGAIDLGHIDLLVEQGFYTNRTDFIRTAIRNQLTTHTSDLNSLKSTGMQKLDPIEAINKIGADINSVADSLATLGVSASETSSYGGTGVFMYNKKSLEQVKKSGSRISLFLIGMLIIDNDVPLELVEETFAKVKVYGMIKARPDVKQFLLNLKQEG